MIRNEKALIKKAEAGDIKAIKTLARRYDKASGRWTDEPKVGETVSLSEFFANMEREENEPCKEKAFEWFMRGAELGDPECMYEVGYRIYDAIGCCKDEEWKSRGKKSFEWYLKSAQAGYVPAMRITAYMYGGLCVEKNEPESFRWYLKAAELGDENSIAEVAKYYAKGTGTDKNLAEADKWLAKLSDEDYRRTLHELAQSSDDDKIMWLDRLIEFGDALALKYKADVYAEEQKFPEALELYIKAGQGDPEGYNQDILSEALVQAGNIYYTGETGTQSNDLALKYYKMAAHKRYIKAMIHCGRLLYDRGQFNEAEKYFDYAANNRERFPFVNRINGVAREYMGHICAQRGDMAEAYRWYALASEDYNNQAMKLKMADAYFYGDGVPQDVIKALVLYDEAGKYPSHEYFFEARTKLAWIHELGELVDKNSATADEHWKELPPECRPERA
ncbi:MAG: SEL1-like repeat protein [Selenomonadaceae bacterium]|nr:SEL1-like repeat protein [Selenomonadaceae bacterium]